MSIDGKWTSQELSLTHLLEPSDTIEETSTQPDSLVHVLLEFRHRDEDCEKTIHLLDSDRPTAHRVSMSLQNFRLAQTSNDRDIEMAGVERKVVQSVITSEPVEDLTGLTVAINRIASNGRHANGYEIRNTILIEEQKERVRYKNGVTVLPVSVQQLFANAQRRNYNHRRTLARNLVLVRGRAKPANACTHHVVALNDDQALFPGKDCLTGLLVSMTSTTACFCHNSQTSRLLNIPMPLITDPFILRSIIRRSTRGCAALMPMTPRPAESDCAA